MRVHPLVESLDKSILRLYRAKSFSDVLIAAGQAAEGLRAVEKRIESLVAEKLGPRLKGDPVKPAGRFAGNVTIADAAHTVVSEHGSCHGAEIEKLLKADGFQSKARHFQANLSTALSRDGRFEKVGPNMWTLKRDKPKPDVDTKPLPISPDLGVGNGVNGYPPNAKIQRLVDRSRQLEAGGE